MITNEQSGPKETVKLNIKIDGPTKNCTIETPELKGKVLPFGSLNISIRPNSEVVCFGMVYIDETKIKEIEGELYAEVEGNFFKLVPVSGETE